MLCFHGNGFAEVFVLAVFSSYVFFTVYLIFFALYVHIINQEDIISSYHTEIIYFA